MAYDRMYCGILPINVKLDKIFIIGWCNITKLSNNYQYDLSKVLTHPTRIDRLINMTFKK